MCRFLYYEGVPVVLADLLLNPKNSLIHQSFKSEEREEPLNGDGFGVAWYEARIASEPGLFRSVTPAWSNANLARLAQITQTSCVLAHVRAASDGLSVSESNCHPFTWGPYAFMHNGSIAAFGRKRRALVALLTDASFDLMQGTTDSELLFLLFLDALGKLPAQRNVAERMASALSQTLQLVHEVTQPAANGEYAYFNICVSDGRHAVASRITTHEPRFAESLHLHAGEVFRLIDGVLRMEPTQGRHGALIVSSEKLSEDPGWQTIPPNHLVVVHSDRNFELRPFHFSA